MAGRDLQVEGEVAVGHRSVLAAPGAAAREQEPAAAARAHQVAGVGVDDVLVLVGHQLAAHVAPLAWPRARRRAAEALQDVERIRHVARRHRDANLAAVLHERQRVEVRRVPVEAPPGTRQVVGRAAHTAAQHRTVDLGRVEGVRAERARAAVGVELRADPAHDQLVALDLERSDASRSEGAQAVDRRHGGSGVGGLAAERDRDGGRARCSVPSSATPSTSMRVISGAASSMAACTASSRVTEDDAQPSQLPSIRSETTPASPSTSSTSTSPPCDAEVGTHRVEGTSHPVIEAERVEVVQDEQRRDEVVVGQPLAEVELLGRELEDARQAPAVQLGDEADDVLDLLPRARVEGRLEVPEELLDAVADDSEVDGWFQAPPSGRWIRLRRWAASSASAPCGAPCRCRGTCGRRTAGTGRSCARPA